MMAQPALLDTTRDVDADLCRNIVSLRQTADLFDDLSDGDPQLGVFLFCSLFGVYG